MRSLKGFIHNLLSSTLIFIFTKSNTQETKTTKKEMETFSDAHPKKKMEKVFLFFLLKLQENANKAQKDVTNLWILFRKFQRKHKTLRFLYGEILKMFFFSFFSQNSFYEFFLS